MKTKLFKIFSFVILLSIISGCGKNENKSSDQNQESKQKSESSQNSGSVTGEVTKINLPTVQCGTCKKTITKALKSTDGVDAVDVNIDEKFVNVTYDKSKTSLDKIEGVIVMSGYQANDKPADKEAYDKLESCCKIGGHDK
ncbi:MAG TPA: heavy-metal-associated domain-containing protein [Ignavibacteria bacterium]|nr:heavy-metal-associated domain-containing protein [Ignavibacteria bacterium]